MKDGDVDYSTYTSRELHEALSGIRRDKFPKNFENIVAALSALGEPLNQDALQKGERFSHGHIEHVSSCVPRNGPYEPNHVPWRERASNLLLSAIIICYGIYGVLVNDLYVPGRRGRGIHLHDTAAWLMLAAAVVGCTTMISVVIDHYDKRDNEAAYRSFEQIAGAVATVLFLSSLAADFHSKFA